jgi:alkanesulfonate monooxygenase SsuD/methylene tetrahydromethanopterin reductase-like flavin-dependent oxidoreductase (luciferase family)
MRIGVGLPNTIPGASGKLLVEWAKHAESLGFSTLSTIGRLIFPTHDELIALAAAAAVTNRIGLFSNVTVSPVNEPVLLAKQAASIDQISGGRFVLGLGVGWREGDFAVVGKDYHQRGRILDAQIQTMQAVWRGELVPGADKAAGPTPTNGVSVPIAIGGTAPQAYERAAHHAIGWTSGGLPPDAVAASVQATHTAFKSAGRTEQPRTWALGYFNLGPDPLAAATKYLTDYYYDWGPGMAAGIPKDPASVLATAEAYVSTGVDEFLFVPTRADLGELDRLIAALGGKTEF